MNPKPSDADDQEGTFIYGVPFRLDDGEEWSLLTELPEPTDAEDQVGRIIYGVPFRLDDGEEWSLVESGEEAPPPPKPKKDQDAKDS